MGFNPVVNAVLSPSVSHQHEFPEGMQFFELPLENCQTCCPCGRNLCLDKA